MIYRHILAFVLAVVLILPAHQTAHADLPVIDPAAILQEAKDSLQEIENQIQMLDDNLKFLTDWETSLHDMETQINQLTSVINQLTDVPVDLLSAVSELLTDAVLKPLGDIQSNLNMLQSGMGVGSCNGASQLLQTFQYFKSVKTDFAAAMLNGSMARHAGLIGCTSTMIKTTQTRLNDLPRLLTQLKACNDVTCINSVSGRITGEVAIINSQAQQAQLVQHQAELYEQVKIDQLQQKQRADDEQVWDLSGGSGGSILSSTMSTTLQPAINNSNTDTATSNGTTVNDAPMFSITNVLPSN